MNDLAPDWLTALMPLLTLVCGYALRGHDNAADWQERAEGLWAELWEEGGRDG